MDLPGLEFEPLYPARVTIIDFKGYTTVVSVARSIRIIIIFKKIHCR